MPGFVELTVGHFPNEMSYTVDADRCGEEYEPEARQEHGTEHNSGALLS